MIKTLEYQGKLYGTDNKDIFYRVYDWPTKNGIPDYNAKPVNKWLKVHPGSYLKATIAGKFRSI